MSRRKDEFSAALNAYLLGGLLGLIGAIVFAVMGR